MQGPNQVRISIRAIGLNFADVFAVLGLYALAGQPPFTPGFEVSGIVQAVGSAVTSVQVGDRVFAVTRFGAYTTGLNIHEDYVSLLRDDWSFSEGAAWPCQALTAWYALCVLGGLNKGACRMLTSPHKRVVVHSAAGGVGLMLLELVRHIGGEVVATIGHRDKIPTLLERGVPSDRIIVRGTDDIDGFEKTVRKRLDGEGVDVVIDPVMGNYFDEGWRLLNRGGRYIVMGSSSMMPSGSLGMRYLGTLASLAWRYIRRPKLDLLAAMNQNRSVAAFNIGALFDRTDLLQNGFDELNQIDMRRPLIGRTFGFADMRDALRFFQSGLTVGKTVVLVDDEQIRLHR